MDKKTNSQKQNYRNITSRIVGYFSNITRPRWLINYTIAYYIKKYKVDMSHFQIPDGGFKSFNHFFTRHFKHGVRQISEDIISPIDGSVFDYGSIDNDNKLFVKHKYYYVEDLINEDCPNLKSYAVLYLSPADYHRVHTCFDMHIESISYIPGTLRSVRKKTVNKKDRVYCRNERIVIQGQSKYGNFYFILIGALMVGKIKLSFNNEMRTNIRKGIQSKKHLANTVSLKKGDEIGYFEMGSSVIILLENDYLTNILPPLNSKIKFGEQIVDTKTFC